MLQNLEFGVFPGTLLPAEADTAPGMDGVMLMHTMMGTIGTSTQLHGPEIILQTGRYLGLKLLWEIPIAGGPCGDDGIADTPPSREILVCGPAPDSCAGNMPVMVENFMTWSYCGRMFTAGQRDFVHAGLGTPLAGRNNLWTAANLALTGCGPQLISSLVTSGLNVSMLEAAGAWRVQFPTQQPWDLTVYSSTGSLVGFWHGEQGSVEIDLHGRSAGLYFLQAMNGTGEVFTTKVALP